MRIGVPTKSFFLRSGTPSRCIGALPTERVQPWLQSSSCALAAMATAASVRETSGAASGWAGGLKIGKRLWRVRERKTSTGAVRFGVDGGGGSKRRGQRRLTYSADSSVGNPRAFSSSRGAASSSRAPASSSRPKFSCGCRHLPSPPTTASPSSAPYRAHDQRRNQFGLVRGRPELVVDAVDQGER